MEEDDDDILEYWEWF